MRKVIIIEEDTSKDINGCVVLKRKILVDYFGKGMVEVYKEELSGKEYAERESIFNQFYKWVVKLRDDLNRGSYYGKEIKAPPK